MGSIGGQRSASISATTWQVDRQQVHTGSEFRRRAGGEDHAIRQHLIETLA